MTERPVSRAMLKLTGELFQEGEKAISSPRYDVVASKILQIKETSGVQIAIVVGGGNIFRGREAGSLVDRSEADSAGMMATTINGIFLREALTRNGAKDARLMTALEIPTIAEPYIKHKARHHLEAGRLVIVAGGLGKPYFSTDSAVAQYANELQCDMIFKASTVDGVYTDDPRVNPEATRYDQITYKEAIDKRLRIMDQTAFAMCEQSNIPIFVFDVRSLDKIPEVIKGDYSVGTLIHS